MLSDFSIQKDWIASIKEYSSMVEKSFEKRMNEVEKEYNSIFEKISSNSSDEFEGEAVALLNGKDRDIKNITDHKQRFRSSMVALIYSYIEFTLDKVCKEYRSHFGLKLKLKDFHGSGINRFSNFMIYAKNLDFKNDHNKFWSEIINQAKIRNKIMHKFCEISNKDNEDKEEKAYIKKNKHLSIKNDSIYIEKEYIDECLSNTEKVFSIIEGISLDMSKEPF